MIRFEGLTGIGELLEVAGLNPAKGMSVGGTYEVIAWLFRKRRELHGEFARFR